MKKKDNKIVNISLPKQLLEVLDNIAKLEMRGRSEMLRVMILSYCSQKAGTNISLKEAEKMFKSLSPDLADAFRKLMAV